MQPAHDASCLIFSCHLLLARFVSEFGFVFVSLTCVRAVPSDLRSALKSDSVYLV